MLDTYTPAEDGQILLDEAAFHIRDPANTVSDDLDSPAAETCLTEGVMPDRPLKKGDRGAGWVLLDSPSPYGVVQLTQASIGKGGWEWVIPGS